MKRGKRVVFGVLRTVVAAGLLAYLVASGTIDWSRFAGLATAWPLAVAALGLLSVDVVVTALRLCVLLRPRGLQLTLPASIRLTLIGTFFNACLPGATGGDVARIYYAVVDAPGRRTEIATVMLLDRACGMFALLLWPLLAAPFFPALTGSGGVRALLGTAAVLCGVMLAGLGLSLSPGVRHSHRLGTVLARLPFAAYTSRVLETVHTYRRHGPTLVAATLLSVLAHTLMVAVTLLVARAMLPGGFSWAMCVLIPMGFLANTLPITPGGIGVGEAAFEGLFRLAGYGSGAEVLLGWRLVMLGPIVAGFLAYLQGRRGYVQQAERGAAASRATAVVEGVEP